MLYLHKPQTWYIAKLKSIDSKLEELPDVKMGQHKGRTVIWFHSESGRREIRPRSREWATLFESAQIRTELISEKRRLLEEWKTYFSGTYDQIKHLYQVDSTRRAALTSAFWNNLTDNACTYEKSTEYNFDGHNFRSRFEMSVAEVIVSLNIPYKYEPCIQIGDNNYYPDFALDFPEFNACILGEVMGKMHEHKYAYDSGQKIAIYSTAGIILGRDAFILCGTDKFIPNPDNIKRDIINIVDKLSSVYVHKQ